MLDKLVMTTKPHLENVVAVKQKWVESHTKRLRQKERYVRFA